MAAGTRAFWSVLGAIGLMLLALVLVSLVVQVVGAVAALAGSAAKWLSAVVIVALWIGMVWAAIRLAFWLIAIVADQAGPVSGLRASLRATRGQWWRLFGLLAVWMLISIGARIPFVVLGMLGKIAGGSIQGAALLISGVGSVIAGTYLSFALLAAFIRFYEDTKAATP